MIALVDEVSYLGIRRQFDPRFRPGMVNQRGQEVGPVNDPIRLAEALLEWFAECNFLQNSAALAVANKDCRRREARRLHPVPDIEKAERPDRIGADLEPGADRFEGTSLLQYADLAATASKCQSAGNSRYPAAGDENRMGGHSRCYRRSAVAI